jgi:glycosyltransferase involved in cell wall biosynthesis
MVHRGKAQSNFTLISLFCFILIPEDYNILAEKIIFNKNNPQQAAAMSQRAKQFVNDKFSMEKNAGEIYNYYITK